MQNLYIVVYPYEMYTLSFLPEIYTYFAFLPSQSRHVEFNFPHKYGTGIASLLKHASKGCIDLITLLCTYDPEERLTAKQALRHPYFKDLRSDNYTTVQQCGLA